MLQLYTSVRLPCDLNATACLPTTPCCGRATVFSTTMFTIVKSSPSTVSDAVLAVGTPEKRALLSPALLCQLQGLGGLGRSAGLSGWACEEAHTL